MKINGIRFSAMMIVAAVAALLVGCGSKTGDKGAAAQESAEAKVLHLYTWSDYFPQEVFDEFQKRTGIVVKQDILSSNEELMAKLQQGAGDYDLINPSDYAIKPLAEQGLLATLDHNRLKNWGNLDAQYLNQNFDPGNKYSLPYFWGTTGFGYNKEKIPEQLESWDALFDSKYADKILMLDDPRECLAVALKRMGKSLNTTDPPVLQQAADMLKQQDKLVRTYNSDLFADKLRDGDVWISHGYNGQLAKLVASDPGRFAYVFPKEGGTIWMDNLCVPAKAKNPDAAYQFIDFILEPEVGGKIVNAAGYASANAAAKKFIKAEILNDKNVYPTPEMLKNGEHMQDLGDTATLIDKLWREVKAQ